MRLWDSFTVGADIDTDALQVALQNAEELESDVDFVNMNVLNKELCVFPDKSFDTVFMNPPFGTRKKGADVGFLEAGLRLARVAVYSMHKTSTRDFLRKKAKNEWGVGFQVLAQVNFDIKKIYKFHRKQSADVEVDLIRLSFVSQYSEVPTL